MSEEGTLAPTVAFVDAAGEIVGLDALLERAAGLPLLLAFFKTSCPTCRLTWPYLQRLHALHGGTAVEVVGVSQDDAPESRRFHAEAGSATFDLLLDPGPSFRASNAFGVEAVPHLVLVSPEGRILRVATGWSRAAMLDLGAFLAARAGRPPVPVVEAGDPVRAHQAA